MATSLPGTGTAGLELPEPVAARTGLRPAYDVVARRVFRRIGPFVVLLFMASYLDRINLGYAALSMNWDLDLSATQYGLAVTVFYAAYLVAGIPSSILSASMALRFMVACAVLLAFAAHGALAADAGAGERVFQSQCSACHAVQPGRNGVGPSLSGLFGRTSGQVAGFHYSDANKAAGITWNADTLDQYLVAPRDMVPGTTMSYPGLVNDTQRDDLITYLGTLH